jgi:hypothetical protein
MVAALIDYSQFIGNANGTTPEVEAASKALRVTPKPEELGSLGGGAYGVASLPTLNQTTLGAITLTKFKSIRFDGPANSQSRECAESHVLGMGCGRHRRRVHLQYENRRRFLMQYNATSASPLIISPLGEAGCQLCGQAIPSPPPKSACQQGGKYHPVFRDSLPECGCQQRCRHRE